MPQLGQIIKVYANSWDAADAELVRKSEVVGVCDKNVVYENTGDLPIPFMNKVKEYVFQYMPDGS